MSHNEVPGDALHYWAVSQGYAYARVLRDGCLVCVEQLFGHQALLSLRGEEGARVKPGAGETCPSSPPPVLDGWIYPSLEAALAAAKAWDGQDEPAGWHRHPTSGRRRPGGDPEREYVFH